jgi:ribose transport system permease protein
MVVGEWDLSVGYVVGFTAMLAAVLQSTSHLSGPMALILTLAGGIVVGSLNGLLVAKFRVASLIATLGIGIALSGLTVGISGSQTIATNIGPIFQSIALNRFLGLATSVWIVIGIAVVLYVLLQHTPTGRRMYAVGGSETVARLAGIRTSRLKILCFVGAGLLAAVGGILDLGQTGAANPSYGAALLLPAFAAVFLGTTSVRPGSFNVLGTVYGLLALAFGFTGLSLAGVPFWFQPVFDGAVLLIAVLISKSGSVSKVNHGEKVEENEE